MNFKKNISLRPYNTFGIEALAESFVEVSSLAHLIEIIGQQKDVFILGGGSNILLTKNVLRPVIHLNLKGREILENSDPTGNKDDDSVFIKVQGGENWHELVLWCIDHDFGGLENLSLIPGNVGTGPMQNIGAYGTEVKDVFHELEALEIATGKIKKFDKESCNFGYRESVFKNIKKNKYIILTVSFKLTRKNHILNTSYGAIQEELLKNNIDKPSIKDVSDAVISIRQSKLPDPAEIGNSGSFFKNPVIPTDHFNRLKNNYPKIPHYIISDTSVKIPAGWLIEQCGYKGMRFGDAGVHHKQALVLVNYGKATGEQIYELAQKILKSVHDQFSIDLEIEVNIV